MPPRGTMFSVSIGRTLNESACGVPHGIVRSATAGQIRAGGGTITFEPETAGNGIINPQHAHVVEGIGASSFGAPEPNPIPKRRRIGGPEYCDPELPLEGPKS